MKEELKTAAALLDFIENSPSCYHVVANTGNILEKAGFSRLFEEDAWTLVPGGKYYVTRGGSSLIAVSLPRESVSGFQIAASHSDSPTFKVKENGEISVDGRYVKLSVEKYGGMIMSSWLDRPLSVAGRLLVEKDKGIESCLFQANRDMLLIPSLAIHMNRKINEGYSFNVKKDLQPLFSMAGEKNLRQVLAETAGVKTDQIVGSDLFLYNRMKGSIWGAEENFLSSPRLDDLQCAWASLEGFVKGKGSPERIMVYCVMDNEEVGSGTRQGAGSTFLQDVLERLMIALGGSREDYLRAVAKSFLISADNAHAVHPNQADKADDNSRPYLNGGPVIKYSANQKYTTDGSTAAVFGALCRKVGSPCQVFHNRPDMEGGSTLGNISAQQVPVPSVDVGLPQLAMHSSYETAGVQDTFWMVQVFQQFFSSTVCGEKDGIFRIS